MDFGITEIVYRAEGNANLVVNLPEHKKVLRLQKGQKFTAPNVNAQKTVDVHKRVAYMKQINKLFGQPYSCDLEIITLKKSEIDRINIICEPFRPIKRLDKIILGQSGILMTDATLLPDTSSIRDINLKKLKPNDTFAIEIKPKQGWMIQEILDKKPNTFDLHGLDKCRYCCLQYLKLKESKIDRVSKFCPRDLFSGDYNRMKNAIEELLKCPQNNLRIFKNGLQCYGDYKDSISLEQLTESIFENNKDFFIKLIIACLLHNYKRSSNEIGKNIKNINLSAGSVLNTLYSVQTLARDNIQFLSKNIFEKEISYNYLSDLLSKNNFQTLDELNPKEKYMFGATAMDSSIIICYKEIVGQQTLEHNSNDIIELENRKFLTQIKIIDIDPKSDNHFRKYLYQTNAAYYETFLHITSQSSST